MIVSFEGKTPRLAPEALVAPTASVIGDVELGEGASVWYGAVLRGDVFPVRLGAGSNVQDNAVVHVTTGRHATIVGCGVTIGHAVVLHGCRVGDRALIGIGSIVLDDAEIGEEALVGAGALVTPGTLIPPRMLALGRPARVVRPLTAEELASVRASGPLYVELARRHRLG